MSALMDIGIDLQRPSEPRESREKSALKMVACVIRPDRLDAVKDALGALNLVGGMMVTNVRGFGRQRGSVEHYMSVPYRIRFMPKVRIELVIAQEDVAKVVEEIRIQAFTGAIGDGKIFIYDVVNALRIRTGEKGVDAL